MVLQLPTDDPVAPALPVVPLKPMKSGMQKMIFVVPDPLLKPRMSGTYAAAKLCTVAPAVLVILLKLERTVKAPNFDRVFMKNIFLLHIIVKWPPLKKIDRACKIKVFVVPKLKFLF
jgi:hypothetical protein